MLITFPLKLGRGLNSREHPMARHRRVKNERARVALFAKRQLKRMAAENPGKTYAVELTRVSPGYPDDDQVVGSLKAVRDEVAKHLGVDDGSERIRFSYRHERRGRGVYEVDVKVEVAFVANPSAFDALVQERSLWVSRWQDLHSTKVKP